MTRCAMPTLQHDSVVIGLCSDEEAADPLLVPPPILDPFVLYHLRENATTTADSADEETSTMH
jgi:hypothetical protein